ncbi:amino acid ABC transporter permease [Paraburkholderia terrae]|jgi:glutamate/aspartate transport system permease protein|uniref:amino acid ABC transporter permease n=1 Tax=Paraburkholderia terrae TaxID=311230 RepID=UPI00296AEF58|nr:amino acid ABC transporter permease [Paraburkholderia terrae]MDW3662248.1 amino acid ABC transporter permease [Paraburkholderia terrae]
MNFDFGAIYSALPFLMEGLAFTVQLTVVACLGGLVLGTGMAVIRQLNVPVVSRVVSAYVTLMRCIPLILVLFWFFFLVPLVLGYLSSVGRPIPLGPKTTAFITFTLFEAAYYAEIVRSGFKAINKGQYEGARALGLSTWTMYSSVIIPQVLRATAPIIVTQTIILFQDTSLVYVLSLSDFLGTAAKIAQRDSKLVEFYTFVAVVYFILCSAGSELAERLRKKTPTSVRRPKSIRVLGLPRP